MFEIGEYVRLKRGHTIMQVTRVYACGSITAKYLNSNPIYEGNRRPRPHTDFVYWDGEMNKPTEEDENMPKLYQTIDENPDNVQYGTYLTKDSRGNIVLEMKGDNTVKSFPPNEIEEVLPYTISIKWFGNSQKYSFISEDGVLKQDDVVMQYNGSIGRVVEVNTKSRKAESVFNGFVLPTRKVEYKNLDVSS